MSLQHFIGFSAVFACAALSGCVSRNESGTAPELQTIAIKSKWKSEPTLKLTVPKGAKLERLAGIDFDVSYLSLRTPLKATLMIYNGGAPRERSRSIKTGLTYSTNQIGSASVVWKTWSSEGILKSETLVKAWEVTGPNPRPEAKSDASNPHLHLLISASNQEEVGAFQSYCRSLQIEYPQPSGR